MVLRHALHQFKSRARGGEVKIPTVTRGSYFRTQPLNAGGVVALDAFAPQYITFAPQIYEVEEINKPRTFPVASDLQKEIEAKQSMPCGVVFVEDA